MTQRVKARFVAWLESRARAKIKSQYDEALAELKDSFDGKELDKLREELDGDYQQWRKDTNDAVGALQYTWNSANCLAALQTIEGCKKLLKFLLESVTRNGRVFTDDEVETAFLGNPSGFMDAVVELRDSSPNSSPPQTAGEKSQSS